ncbi:hypothetical protein ACQ4PT_029221 [Festuca glaucescens]
MPPPVAPSSETLPPLVAPIPGAPDVGAEHLVGSADHDRAGGSGYTDFEHDLEDRFDGLNLCGEEETDLDFSDYKLDKIPVWARVQGIPDGLMKKKDLAERVAKKAGEPPFTVNVTEGKINPSKYLRARVFLDLNKPLVRVVTITLKERKKYAVYYEKLPDFCFFCGKMGHDVIECGDGVHSEAECEWGDDLRVVFEPFNPPGGDRGGNNRGGRTDRGRGRGRNSGDTYADAENMDLDNNMQGSSGARKRLNYGAGKTVVPPGSVVEGVSVANMILMLENANKVVDKTLMSTPQKIQEPKRRRRNGVDGDDSSDNLGSAASFEEDRRDQ